MYYQTTTNPHFCMYICHIAELFCNAKHELLESLWHLQGVSIKKSAERIVPFYYWKAAFLWDVGYKFPHVCKWLLSYLTNGFGSIQSVTFVALKLATTPWCCWKLFAQKICSFSIPPRPPCKAKVGWSKPWHPWNDLSTSEVIIGRFFDSMSVPPALSCSAVVVPHKSMTPLPKVKAADFPSLLYWGCLF